jgi:hypothetical protein
MKPMTEMDRGKVVMGRKKSVWKAAAAVLEEEYRCVPWVEREVRE